MKKNEIEKIEEVQRILFGAIKILGDVEEEESFLCWEDVMAMRVELIEAEGMLQKLRDEGLPPKLGYRLST